MEIESFKLGAIQANCYVVTTQNTLLIVDPAEFDCQLKAQIDTAGDKQKFILLTHRHFDHVCGAADIKEYCGAKIVIHTIDERGLWDDDFSLATRFGILQKFTKSDILVNDGDSLVLGDVTVKVLHTPGHTAGSVCYIIEKVVFTGDTLFCGTIGRYDFPSGDFKTLIESVKKLVMLKGDYDLYPGHMEATTLQYERENNPYITRRVL